MAKLNDAEVKELFENNSKHRITLLHPSKNERKQIRNTLRSGGLTDLVEMEEFDEAWEKLNLSSTNILIFSMTAPGAADFLSNLVDSARFAVTPIVIFSNKMTEHAKLYANLDLLMNWRDEPMNGLNVEQALIPIFLSGVIGKSQLASENIALEKYTAAVHLLEEDRFDEAKEQLRLALKENPDFFEAYIKIADSLIGLQEYEPAKRVLGRAGTLREAHPKVLERLVRIAAETTEMDNAIREFDMLIEQRPKDPMFIISVGNEALNQGWIDKAIEYYERAQNIDPNLIHVYNRMGMAHSRAKRFDRSLAMYEKAEGIDPKDAGVQFNIGMMYYRKKENDKAYEYFSKSAKLDPTMEEAPEWAEKIKKMIDGSDTGSVEVSVS